MKHRDRRKTAIIGLCLFGLLACEQQPGGEPVIRQDISGEQVRDITAAESEASTESGSPAAVEESSKPAFASACTPYFFEEVLLTDCLAEPGQHAIETVLAPDSGEPYRTIAAYAETVAAEDVAFAMNAGMFGDDGKAIGYYVENANRLKELNRDEGEGNFHMLPNGVFFGSDGEWRVLTSDKFYSTVTERPKFGTQSGPMLVIDGELHPDFQADGPSRAIRNGVGIDDEGRAHFVISEAPISFGKFARFFRDQLKVSNALYLDGNVSALWDPSKNRLDTGSRIGPIVVVKHKPQ